MLEFKYELEDLQFDIDLLNATLDYLRDKYFEALQDEDMDGVYFFTTEANKIKELLDKKYKRQEKIYHDLLILHL